MAAGASAHRPEIDGLRAIAVAAVILFHAGFEPFAGGFVGVDVFFAISGFLITGLILKERAGGAFDLAAFYARRARRILPALFVVMLACVAPALVLMTAAQRTDFFATFASVAVFGSNIRLAATTGYFDAPAELRPLLHTWSLGVEEQYYFFFPVLVLALWRFGRARLAFGVLALAAASLALGEWGWRHAQDLNFFLTPTRAWELLAGSLGAMAFDAARASARWPGRLARDLMAGAGLFAVLGSVLLLGRHTPSPSLWCAFPVGGTLLVLLFAERDTLVARLLSLRALTAVGLVSYSAYLWHQPLFAFARISTLDPLSPALKAALIAATFVLAAASWRFVERPARARGGRLHAMPAARVVRLALAASAALAAAGWAASLASDRATPAVPATVLTAFGTPARTSECFDLPRAHLRGDGAYCAVNPGAQPAPSFLLYGDSHSLQLLGTFEAAARAAGRTGFYTGYSGCAPLPGTVPLMRGDQDTRDCRALNARMFALARKLGVKDIYLVAKWSYYTEMREDFINAIGLADTDAPTRQASRRAFAQGAANALAEARAAGARLHVIAQVPHQRHAPDRVYERVYAYGGEIGAQLEDLSVTRRAHEALQAYPDGVWRSLAEGGKALDFADFTELLCDARRCPIGTPSSSYYQDASHLSPDGALRLLPAVTKLLGSP